MGMDVDAIGGPHLPQAVPDAARAGADHPPLDHIAAVAHPGQPVAEGQRLQVLKILVQLAQVRLLLVQVVLVVQPLAVVAENLIVALLAGKQDGVLIPGQVYSPTWHRKL